jgi:hypothetical protein
LALQWLKFLCRRKKYGKLLMLQAEKLLINASENLQISLMRMNIHSCE